MRWLIFVLFCAQVVIGSGSSGHVVRHRRSTKMAMAECTTAFFGEPYDFDQIVKQSKNLKYLQYLRVWVKTSKGAKNQYLDILDRRIEAVEGKIELVARVRPSSAPLPGT